MESSLGNARRRGKTPALPEILLFDHMLYGQLCYCNKYMCYKDRVTRKVLSTDDTDYEESKNRMGLSNMPGICCQTPKFLIICMT